MNDSTPVSYIRIAREAILREAESVKNLSTCLDDEFDRALALMHECKGKVIVTGVGKSGHIGGKIAATFSSTGTPSFFLSPMEGLHGDVGVISTNDVILAISKSGEGSELIDALEYPKRLNVPIIAITVDASSSLGKLATIVLRIPDEKEVCPMNLAPTTSTTMTLVLGDAIAVALMKMKNFREEQFAQFHPGGMLGKKLRKIRDIMTDKSKFATAPESITIEETLRKIISIPGRNMGICVFIDANEKVIGIITDGDMKRLLLKFPGLLSMKASDVMTKTPLTIGADEMAVMALNIMEEKNIRQLVVTDDNGILAGIVDIDDIIRDKIL